MDGNLDKRSEYLDGLEKFISESYERLKFVTESLGWDLERFEEEKEMVSCPLNPEHRMPPGKLDAHLERCERRAEGYAEEDVELPEGRSRGVPSPTSVLIDEELQQRILQDSSSDPSGYPAAYCWNFAVSVCVRRRPVPRTADRARADFTPGERLAIYNYAAANTRAPAVVKPEELNLTYKKSEEEARPKSRLELLMEMRDAKRRRISYRSKKVHTSRKSHLEILREVIGNQMEFLEELNKPEEEEEPEPPAAEADQTSYSGQKAAAVDERGGDPEGARWEEDDDAGRRKHGRPHQSSSRRGDDDRRKRRREGDHHHHERRRRSDSGERRRGSSRSRHGWRRVLPEEPEHRGPSRRRSSESPRSEGAERENHHCGSRGEKKAKKSHKHKKKKRKKHRRRSSSPPGNF